MPTVRDGNEVIAILLADIHLSLKAPVWRSAEEDWMEAQARPLKEVGLLQEKYSCPVICAGDIFDRSRKIADGWNAPAELINFAINHLPEDMYTIPGQHDLPNHQYSDIKRSAYWTLVKANTIKDIGVGLGLGGVVCVGNNLVLCGFPPGLEIDSLKNLCEDGDNGMYPAIDGRLVLAVVHDYIWVKGKGYPNAPDEKMLLVEKNPNKVYGGKYYGYDVVVYGDNHKGFTTYGGKTTIFNCGTLMRRKSDEIDYKPQVGLLLDDGSVVPHFLDTSEDRCLDKVEEKIEKSLNMKVFFDELEKLGDTALDFKAAIEEFMERGQTSDQVKQIIIKAMENEK